MRKFGVVWNTFFIAWCVGFMIYDIYAGEWFLAVMMGVLAVVFANILRWTLKFGRRNGVHTR